MTRHHATIEWQRGPTEFKYQSYTRDHTWSFEGGIRVNASAAPGYLGNADFVDPEEAYVASLSSCHMLTFLAIAAQKGLVVDRYRDPAVGHMGRNADGKMTVARVVLRPEISFGGPDPAPEELERIHDAAHRECFIANSVHTSVTVEGRPASVPFPDPNAGQAVSVTQGPVSSR